MKILEWFGTKAKEMWKWLSGTPLFPLVPECSICAATRYAMLSSFLMGALSTTLSGFFVGVLVSIIWAVVFYWILLKE